MTHKEFMEGIQQYYGKYENEFVARMVFAYIKKEIHVSCIDMVFAAVLKNVTNKYKQVPDVAQIEEAYKKDKAYRSWDYEMVTEKYKKAQLPAPKKEEYIDPAIAKKALEEFKSSFTNRNN